MRKGFVMMSASAALQSSLLMLLIAVMSVPVVTAQELPYFVDAIEVEVVNIDVVVSDRKGKLISGLTRDDFVLLVDGEPVELTNFLAVSDGRPVIAASGIAGEPEPPAAEPEATLPESQQLNMVVFVDDSNMQPSGRRIALAALRKFLRLRWGTGQRIMLVRYADSLEVHTELTDNPAEIIAGIDEIESSVPPGMQRFSEWTRIVREIELSASTDHEEKIAAYAQSLRHECRVKIALMKSFIDTLTGLKGRKVIVLVSDGMPMNPGQSLFNLVIDDPSKAQMRAQRYSIRRDLKNLSDYANANRVTFHTLNSGGWSSFELQGTMSTLLATQIVTQDISSIADWNHTEALSGLAVETGGQSLRKANLATLQQVANDLDSYYSLGFTPQDEETPTPHEIKIKVKREGTRLRYRSSFRTITQEERLANETVAALIGGSDENRLLASLELADTGRKDGRKKFIVPVTVRFPSEVLVFMEDGDTWKANVIFHITAQGEGGEHIDPVKGSLPISLPDDAYSNGYMPEIVYDLELRVRQGTTRISISVHDPLGGMTTALVETIHVDKQGTITVDSSI
jgi:VWFA-related protein